VGRTAVILLGLLEIVSCGSQTPETRLRKALASQTSGVIRLPGGVVEVSSELTLAPGAHDLEIDGAHTLLIATDQFKGRAVLAFDGAKRIKLHDLSIDGNRSRLAKPLEIAPPENAFRVWYPNNGVLADQVEGLEIRDVGLANIVNFPILVSRSKQVVIDRVDVRDSGSKNAHGHNNLSGGILIEEGSSDFEVRNCTFHWIAGNGLWTHSMSIAPRQQNGVFANNQFDTVGRDALQVGHASHVRVEGNTGVNIGYPLNAVDMESLGTPVGIDTAGNVDLSEYAHNTFEEVNGKCIDLDGFHDGAVRDNRCSNRKSAADYPHGHFGITMNNTDPAAHPNNVEISGNTIDGAKFGGLFLMGSGNRVFGNHFLHLNLAGCNEAKTGCEYLPQEPEMLESGIYLSRGVVRMEQTAGNAIRDNEISGHKMKTRCIAFGPGVERSANTIERNICSD
jgi:Right handed beta helix region